jgi:DNA-binding transcriptional ArsR family regulator
MLTKEDISGIKKSIAKEDERTPVILGALADRSRFRIFKLLMRYQDLCVTDIAGILEVSVPAASQQLRILEMAGLVKKHRRGQMICYEVKKDNSLLKFIVRIFD